MGDASDDYLDLLDEPDEPSALEKQQAYSAALRRKRDAGQLGLLTGDPVLSRLGQNELAGADRGEQQLMALGQRRAALKNARDISAANQAASMERLKYGLGHPKAMTALEEELARKRLGLIDSQIAKNSRSKGAAAGAVASGLPAGIKPQFAEQTFVKDFLPAISPYAKRGDILKSDVGKRLFAADRLKALVAPNGEIDPNLSPRMVTEATMALANLISQGSPTVETLHELAPQTAASDWARLMEKIKNEPQSADAQDFVKQMLASANREESTAKDQIRSMQLLGAKQFRHIHGWGDAFSKRYEQALQDAGLDPAEVLGGAPVEGAPGAPTRAPASPNALGAAPVAKIQTSGSAGRAPAPVPAPAAKQLSPDEAAALKWATENVDKDPRAAEILAHLTGAGSGP